MSKRAHSLEDKMKIIKALEDGIHTISELESIYNVHNISIYDWVYKYEKYGEDGLKETSTWRRYSKELKLEAVTDYLSGEYSIREVTRKYEIPSTSTLRRWIKKYNSHRELKDTSKGRTGSMTKGRKTTWNERVQIVLDCLGNGKDYQSTAEVYGISYQQVYQWVKKYEDGGDEALKDKRGRKKEEAELTSEEKIRLEMKRLERENEKKRYKQSSTYHVAENVLNREFTAEKPNEKWVTDVTEFKYGLSKKAYLSAIRDLYDGSIVSYVLGHSNNNKLVFDTLDQAIVLLDGEHPLIHSDRGFQYTSKGFKRKIDKAEMTQSMSQVGRCIDNGPMESFWGTLKCEKYYLNKYKTFEELSLAIDDYILFYNYDRYQKRLNGLSPMEYRAKTA